MVVSVMYRLKVYSFVHRNNHLCTGRMQPSITQRWAPEESSKRNQFSKNEILDQGGCMSIWPIHTSPISCPSQRISQPTDRLENIIKTGASAYTGKNQEQEQKMSRGFSRGGSDRGFGGRGGGFGGRGRPTLIGPT